MMSVTPMLAVSALQPGVLSSSTSAISYLPPQPTAAGQALVNGLWDPTIRGIAQTDYNRDGYITRNDMMEIMKTGSNQYTFITSYGVHDLLTLVNNSSTVGMPGYVQNLANKTLFDGPTYAFYASGLMNYSASNPNYAVYDMMAAQALGQQANNWFLGTVRPDPVLRNSDGTVAVTAVYSQVNSLPLFANGTPVYQDVQQGQVGDCWLLASLAEVADRNPTAIKNMFIDNGDGTYTVRFFNNGTPDYVTVDNFLPGAPRNYKYPTPYSATYDRPLTDTWVALAEKAYIQEFNPKGSDSYQGLGGGDPYYALSAITGKPTSDFNVTSYVISYPSPATITNVSSIAAAWSQGQYVVLATPGQVTSVAGITTLPPLQVVPNHVYALVGYASGQFTLFNPWGTDGGYLGSRFYAGSFTGDANSIAANFSFWSQAGSAPSAVVAPMAIAGALPATDAKPVTLALNPAQLNFAQSVDNSPGSTDRFAARWQAENAMLAAISQAQRQTAPERQSPVAVALTDRFAVDPASVKRFATVDAALAEMFGAN